MSITVKEIIFAVVAIFTIGYLISWVTVSALAIPDVYISQSTGSCVQVINIVDTNYTCENYPYRFNHIWVK